MRRRVKVASEPNQDMLLFSADVDADTILSYDDSIDLDTERVKSASGDSLSTFWQNAVSAYVDDSMKDVVQRFLSIPYLRESYACGRMTECIEYPCIVAGDTLWLRASYELSANEEGHICVRVLVVDMTLQDAPDDLERI